MLGLFGIPLLDKGAGTAWEDGRLGPGDQRKITPGNYHEKYRNKRNEEQYCHCYIIPILLLPSS